MPRRQILSSEEKERLLIVPDDDVFLTRMCFLSEHDLALINKHRRPANRLGFAVLLCYLRGPGFPPDKSISPRDCVVFRLAAHLKVQSDLWAEYASREVTRWEHLAELYRYLELSPFNRARQKNCIRHLYPHAMRTDRGFLLAEEMLSWLHNNRGLRANDVKNHVNRLTYCFILIIRCCIYSYSNDHGADGRWNAIPSRLIA